MAPITAFGHISEQLLCPYRARTNLCPRPLPRPLPLGRGRGLFRICERNKDAAEGGIRLPWARIDEATVVHQGLQDYFSTSVRERSQCPDLNTRRRT